MPRISQLHTPLRFIFSGESCLVPDTDRDLGGNLFDPKAAKSATAASLITNHPALTSEIAYTMGIRTTA